MNPENRPQIESETSRIAELEREVSKLKERNEELEERNTKLERIAFYDEGTGLLNRHGLKEELIKKDYTSTPEVETERRDKTPNISLLVLDIDRFKSYNDTFGHPVGDEILRKVAEQLQATVRKSDLVARWGGEEIVVVFEGTDENDILRKFHTVTDDDMEKGHHGRARLNVNVNIEGVDFTVTLSGGVTDFNPKEESFEDAFKRADQALYAAKQGREDDEPGRDQILGVEQLKRKELKDRTK